MSIEELDDLPPGTTIYIPTDWEVVKLIYAGPIYDRSSYTLLHPPDADGVVTNKRPVYLDAMTMKNATIDERSAWVAVKDSLLERIRFIYKNRLKHNEKGIS